MVNPSVQNANATPITVAAPPPTAPPSRVAPAIARRSQTEGSGGDQPASLATTSMAITTRIDPQPGSGVEVGLASTDSYGPYGRLPAPLGDRRRREIAAGQYVARKRLRTRWKRLGDVQGGIHILRSNLLALATSTHWPCSGLLALRISLSCLASDLALQAIGDVTRLDDGTSCNGRRPLTAPVQFSEDHCPDTDGGARSRAYTERCD
jgi:hypothetical protein